MAEINAQSILNSLLPEVYIRKITLQTAGSTKWETNPHIDHDREPGIVRNPLTGQLEREVIIPRLDKTNEKSDPLTVDIQLVINERLEGAMIPTWFGNQDFLKYFKLRIVQSTDVNFTRNVIQGYVDIKKIWEDVQGSREIKIISIKEEIGTSMLDQYSWKMDSDGVKVYEINIDARFVVKSSGVQHLSYFAITYIDIEQMIIDYQLDLGSNSLRSLDSKVTAEMVIDDYVTISQSYIFMTEGGSAWGGATNYTGGKWWTGEAYDTNSKVLQMVKVYNNKIQDFRHVEEIQKFQLDFGLVENEILQRKMLGANHMDPLRKTNYFTDLFMARDVEGNCRFCFGLDFLKVVRENTIFGKLYRKDNYELIRNVKINSMKIKRVRVGTQEVSEKTEYGTNLFSQNDVEDVIAVSGDVSIGNFAKSKTDVGVIREIKFLLEAFNDDDNSSIRHFTGIDKSISGVTQGKYQYGIDMELEDFTIDYLKSRMDLLIASYKFLQEYYNEIEKIYTSPNKFDMPIDSPYIDSIREKKSVVSKKENFSLELVHTMLNKWGDNNPASPWILPAGIYLETMSVLVENFDMAKYGQTLFSFAHPITGNLSGIRHLLAMIELLISRIKQTIKNDDNGCASEFTDKMYSTAAKGSSNAMKNKIGVQIYFPNVYDASIPKDVGYDYLSTDVTFQEDTYEGLKIVSKLALEKRVGIEGTKPDNPIPTAPTSTPPTTTTTRIPILNEAGQIVAFWINGKKVPFTGYKEAYLTPSNVRTGADTSVNFFVADQVKRTKSQDAIAATIAEYNSQKDSIAKTFGNF